MRAPQRGKQAGDEEVGLPTDRQMSGFEPGVVSRKSRALPVPTSQLPGCGPRHMPRAPPPEHPRAQAQSHLVALEGARAGACASGQDVPSPRD